MTTWLVASFGLALIAGAATTILIASWPRRVTAEEWILRRRQASTPHTPKARRGWLLGVRLPSPRRRPARDAIWLGPAEQRAIEGRL